MAESQPKTCSFIKKETQMFSCEFCECSVNPFFTEHLQTTISVSIDLNFKWTDLIKLLPSLLSTFPILELQFRF